MDVLMPQLGETVAEGTVTRWYKNIGDAVSGNELLFDVETDKVATEIPAPVAGILSEILVPAGQTVKVGTRIAVIRAAGEAAATAAQAASAALSAAAQAASPAPSAAERAASAAAPAAAEPTAEPTAATQPQRGADRATKAPGIPRDDVTTGHSPVVRRLLAEHALDPATVVGTGRGGRITREDVLAHIEQRGSAAAPASRPVSPPHDAASPFQSASTSPAAAAGRFETVQPLNSIRRRSAAALTKSWTTIPHVLQAVEADFLSVDKARTRAGGHWKAAEGFAITYLPFIAHAVCNALAKFPRLNARIDGDNLVLSARVNLGIAIDLGDEGLIVPVIKDAQAKSLTSIAREIHGLAEKARGNRLKPDDLTEATYTLSNSGVFGTLITAAIINPPQVAILSIDGVRKKPVVIESADGDLVDIRPVGVLAQSFDHRAVDGAYSAAFLRELKSILETRDWSGDLPA